MKPFFFCIALCVVLRCYSLHIRLSIRLFVYLVKFVFYFHYNCNRKRERVLFLCFFSFFVRGFSQIATSLHNCNCLTINGHLNVRFCRRCCFCCCCCCKSLLHNFLTNISVDIRPKAFLSFSFSLFTAIQSCFCCCCFFFVFFNLLRNGYVKCWDTSRIAKVFSLEVQVMLLCFARCNFNAHCFQGYFLKLLSMRVVATFAT